MPDERAVSVAQADERLAAVADVLRVLGGAPFDLDAVLQAILRAAARLCQADRGFIYLLDGDVYRHVADVGAPPEVVAFNVAHPIRPGRGTVTGRTVLERGPVHLPDVLADPEYEHHEAQRLGGFRAILGVPMLRRDVVIGVLDFWRTEPRPFSRQQVELVRSFADQAALAVTLAQLQATVERQRSELARYVSPQVAALITSDAGEALLAGHRREITVLFCDLRGFTSFAEDREPTEVVETLNRYLSEMTDAIMDHGGTLVSYMGDGIMAVFGAPIEQADHADRAIAAAREMLDVRLPAFCEWMRESGRGDGFAMGIGLNSGEVMSGQVGSERRMEYTTIGDTTNTASRLEGMTKGSGYPIFIADSTREARLQPEPELVPVGEFEVRGREHPLQVWSLPQPAAVRPS